MYVNDVDFYNISETKQRRLVRNKRVAAGGRLLTELPDGEPAIRVFKRSLDQLLFDKLENGQYTINELADHFSVQPEDVRRILNRYRRRGADSFTNENFKLNLLEERNGVLRGVNNDGRSLYYTLQTIPFFARVVDPTLIFSLLHIKEHVDTLPHIVNHIPAGEVTELDEDYAFVVGEYWNIDPEEVFDFLVGFDRAYLDSPLLPLPYVGDDEHYERVSRRFRQVDAVYNKYRGSHEQIREVGEEFLERVEQNQAGISTYQVMSIDIADFEWYAEQSGNSELYDEIQSWIDQIARILQPNDSTDEADKATEEEINLRDEVQLVLSEEPQPPADIYESLPRDIQLGVDQSTVQTVLDQLANADVISKVHDGSTPRYSKDQEKTWE